jgi:hypothetical protein
MNNDIEAFPEVFLAWFLQTKDSPEIFPQEGARKETFSRDTLESSSQEEPIEEIEVWELDEFDQLESEVLNASLASSSELTVSPLSNRAEDPFTLQDRFQALVKRRLKTELQNNPPLFPWEKEISDYEPEEADTEFVSPDELWTAQLNKLHLPVPIPADIVAQLFDRCEAVVQSSTAEGVKLVRAVEGLFPGQSQKLKQFAGVLLGAKSSPDAAAIAPRNTPSQFPSSYEVATPTEQMVLLLIAARQIIGSLTLSLSPAQSIVERQWLTAVGQLVLQAEYQVERRLFASLRVRGQFPCGGSLKLQVGQASAIAQRPDPGQLSVELSDLELDQIYPIEVLFPHLTHNPLIFGVCPTT